MLFADDEQDFDLEEEDADLDDENSDEDELDDEDEESDSDDSDEEEDDDEKPVTRKELKEMLRNRNKSNARDRVASKNKKGPVTKQPSDIEKTVEELKRQNLERAEKEKKQDFALENNLTRQQTELVFKLTKRPTAKFLNIPHVKAALDAIKQSENVARNTPSGSGKRGRTQGGDKKWTELPADERQSNFSARRQSILAGKR